MLILNKSTIYRHYVIIIITDTRSGGVEMYSVAILDDEKSVVEQLQSMILAYESIHGVQLKTTGFVNNGSFRFESLLGFDIFILDINMPGLNGLQIAKKIREKNEDSVIIFCTNYAQYALNGYEVSALGYIIKPITEYSLFKNLDRAVSRLDSRTAKAEKKEKIVVKTADGQKMIDIDKIVYIEIKRHDLYFYYLENDEIVTVKTRGTMREIAEQLCRNCFARCNASYLVNMEHIDCIVKNKSQIQLTGGITLSLSRKYKKEFTDRFMEYIQG